MIDSFTELTNKTKFERLGPHEGGEKKELTVLSSFQGMTENLHMKAFYFQNKFAYTCT